MGDDSCATFNFIDSNTLTANVISGSPITMSTLTFTTYSINQDVDDTTSNSAAASQTNVLTDAGSGCTTANLRIYPAIQSFT